VLFTPHKGEQRRTRLFCAKIIRRNFCLQNFFGMRACHSVARAFGRGLKQPSGLFPLAPFIRFLACGQVKRGAPALAVGLAFPPAPPARSRVASSGVFRQGLRKRVPRPCLSPPRSPSPRASASARRVGFALPLGSNRLRGSLRLCTASASPHAGPPLASPFSASAPGRGALARLPCGSAGSGGLRSSPPALKENTHLRIFPNLHKSLASFQPPPARHSWRGRRVVLSQRKSRTPFGDICAGVAFNFAVGLSANATALEI
jgi:hypothetical protein